MKMITLGCVEGHIQYCYIFNIKEFSDGTDGN